jgi:hypothetical protein
VARRLFTVADTFTVQGRGIVLVPGIDPAEDERFKVGDPLLLKRPDGAEGVVIIGGLEFVHPYPGWIAVLLEESRKEDIPIGTEVWSIEGIQANSDAAK